MKLEKGERLPFGFGYAWENWEEETREVYPVPFNLLFRWLRRIWFFLVRKPRGSYDKAFKKGYDKGYRDGYCLKWAGRRE